MYFRLVLFDVILLLGDVSYIELIEAIVSGAFFAQNEMWHLKPYDPN